MGYEMCSQIKRFNRAVQWICAFNNQFHFSGFNK